MEILALKNMRSEVKTFTGQVQQKIGDDRERGMNLKIGQQKLSNLKIREKID